MERIARRPVPKLSVTRNESGDRPSGDRTTPGTVISGHATGSAFERRLISASGIVTFIVALELARGS
jgi:hypothetical protein